MTGRRCLDKWECTMNALRLAMLAAKTPQKQTAEVSKSIGFTSRYIYIYIYHYNAIIYLEKP